MRLFSDPLLDELAKRAAASPRRRAHLNVHADAVDLVQRFFVAVDRDSYIRPHRHLAKSELAIVVRGAFDVITFDERGSITGRETVGAGTPLRGFEMPRATWHTLIAREDGSTFLEIKEGPYDPATASQFAPWSPEEGAPQSEAFLRRLRT
ncbi:MAG: WbuC family cupin fold metalloprotein [Steroidobacteraceae bacterium]